MNGVPVSTVPAAIRLRTTGRGKAVFRWLDRIQGKNALAVVIGNEGEVRTQRRSATRIDELQPSWQVAEGSCGLNGPRRMSRQAPAFSVTLAVHRAVFTA